MPLWSRAFKMFYFTDLDKQQIFLFFDLFWSVLSPSGIFTFTETPRHSNFFSAGSFAVRCGDHLWSWDHLRSNLGIICGRGSFAALYMPLSQVSLKKALPNKR